MARKFKDICHDECQNLTLTTSEAAMLTGAALAMMKRSSGEQFNFLSSAVSKLDTQMHKKGLTQKEHNAKT